MEDSLLGSYRSPQPATDRIRQYLGSGRIVPYFQPIVSTDSGLVYGHEALGRLETTAGDGSLTVKSLGPVFAAGAGKDATRAEASRLETIKRDVDRRLREAAIAQAAAAGGDQKLFLNISPSFILHHLSRGGSAVPYTIALVRKYGIDPRRIVLEITEENLDADAEELTKMIDTYREEGFSIAIDDVGSASSNLDRVGLFKPDIIKIDFRLLDRSAESYSFRHILDALALLADRIGSELLFEGIEREEHFRNALSYGARYLQGYLFSDARPAFRGARDFETEFRDRADAYFDVRLDRKLAERKRTDALLEFAASLDLDLSALESGLASRLSDFADPSHRVIRVFATDPRGIQTTPNYFPAVGSLRVDESAYRRCRSNRPYFFDHIVRRDDGSGGWTVSTAYRDILFDAQVRTLARTVDGAVLFLDVVEPGENDFHA